jgi:transcriptional regulator with XRE-family HTH domain
MLMADLQNRLRTLVRERITAGELTGTELARRAGFRQAHVSNFLNGRRGLSIEAMDRIMQVMRLQVGDLVSEEQRSRPLLGAAESAFDSVPLVESVALLHRNFVADEIVEFLHFKKSFLRRIRPAPASEREKWQRFVLIKADKESCLAMRPRLTAGATLLIDRHHNSLQSYRRGEPNIYVVKCGTGWPVRYLELQGSQLTLRPENQEWPLGFVRVGKGENFADYIVGRVAHIAVEA